MLEEVHEEKTRVRILFLATAFVLTFLVGVFYFLGTQPQATDIVSETNTEIDMDGVEPLVFVEGEAGAYYMKNLDGEMVRVERLDNGKMDIVLNSESKNASLAVGIPFEDQSVSKADSDSLLFESTTDTLAAEYGGKVEISVYSKEPETIVEGDKVFVINENGGVEFDTILYAKPQTNTISFPIRSEGLGFYYQPPLTEEEEDGETCTETQCVNEEGRATKTRPEHVVGSYAVYTLNADGSAAQKTFHIYRPKVFDASGEEVWGQLAYESGMLSVSVPQEFLDTATYPVTIDPTFGYTSVGGTSGYEYADYLTAGSFVTPLDVSVATGVSLFFQLYDPGEQFKAVLLDSSCNIIPNGVGIAADAPTPYAWAESTFATPPTLAPNTQYFIGMAFNGWPDYMYDTVPGHFNLRDTTNSFASPQNPTCTDANDKMISAYVSYDAVVLSSNDRPDTPSVSGPTTGTSGSTYTFDLQSSDPNGHTVSYGIDWGMDGVSIAYRDWDDIGTYSRGVWGDGNFVYVADSSGASEGIHSYTVGSNGVLTLVDSDRFDLSGTALTVWGDGNFVYLGDHVRGVHSYSVDGSGMLTHLDQYVTGDSVGGLWGDGTYLFAAESYSGGIKSYSVDGSGNISLVDSHIPGHGYTDVWGDGNFVYATAHGSTLNTYSVDAGGNLTLIDSDNQGQIPYGVWGDGNFIYVANNDGGLLSYSVDAGGNITLVDSDYQSGYAYGVWGDGNFIYVGGTFGIQIYSVDVSGQLTFITSYDPGRANDIWTDGDYIYIAESNGLMSFEVNLGVDEWVPLTGSVPSGTLQSVDHAWSTAGVKTFQVLARDGFGATSLYSPHTITLTNTAPTTPTISGPTSGETHSVYSFSLLSDDPGDLIRYGIDWNVDGVVDEWFPPSTYASSGVPQVYKKSWTTTGSKTFQVLAEDDEGARSGWQSHTISISPTSKNILFYDGGEDWTHNVTCGSGHPWTTCAYGDGYVRSVNNTVQEPAVGGWYISAWDLDNPDTGTTYLTAYFDATVCTDLTLDFYVSAGTSLENSPNEAARLEVFNGSVWNQEYISDDPLIAGNEDEDGVWHQYSIDITGYISSNTGIRLLGRPTDLRTNNEWHGWDEIRVWCSGVNTEAPTIPNVSGTIQGEIDTNYQFDFKTSDPNGDMVRYGIDWDNDGDVEVATGDEWLPASGYGVDDPFNWNAQFVNSGVGQSTTTRWSTIGPKNFRVFGQDENGNFSVWTPHTIYIGSDPAKTIISGNTSGVVGTSYDFSLATNDVAGGDSDGLYLENIKEFGTGLYHTCALTYAGEMYCWGQAGSGYLGNGQTSGYYPTPVRVQDGAATGADTDGTYLVNVKEIAVGDVHTCAITHSNNTYCWGDSMSGRLGDGQDAIDRSTPVKVQDGAATGTDTDGTYLINVREITAGGTQTCAVTNSDRLYCWGSATAGQLGDGQNTINRFTPVRVQDGAATGTDTDGTYLVNVKSIIAGGMHTCAITNSGNAYCWGNTLLGRLGNGATTGDYFSPSRVVDGAATGTDTDGTYLVNVKDISGGGGHSCATTYSGNAYCWGWSGYGQLGDGQTATDIPTPVRVQDGAATGADTDGTYLTNIKDVAVGGFHSCALSNSGNTYCWGGSAVSQLGDGQNTTNRSTPVKVLDGAATGVDTDGTYLANMVNIESRRDHTCAINDFGNLYCWGAGDRGQLGDNQTTSNQSTPVKVYDGVAASTVVYDQVRYGIDWDMQGGGELTHSNSYSWATGAINVWGDGGDNLFVAGGRHIYSAKLNPDGTVIPKDGQYYGSQTATGVWGDGRYVYFSSIYGTGSTSAGDIRSYTVDNDGNFTQIDSFTYGSGAWGLEVTGDDRFIYLANGGGGIRSFTVDDYGNLSEADVDTTSVKADDVWADGNFVYLADGDGFIYTYSVDNAGNFTLESSYSSTTPGLYADSVWGDGTFLFATLDNDGLSGGLHSFSIDPVTGALTYIDSDHQSTVGGANDYADSVWGDGRFVYVGNKSGGIHSYMVDQNGYLTHVDNEIPADGLSYGMWSNGDYVYLALSNDYEGIEVYAVSDGVDEWTSFGAANISQIASYTWSVGGNQTFQVTTEDNSGGYAPWSRHTINLGFPDVTGTRGNVSGRAWSSKLGEYVSFDCADSVGGDSCATLPYGVNIQGTPVAGDFEGHAFNDSVGWIAFNAADLGTCGTVGNLATDNTVTGYARVMYAATESCMNLEGTSPNAPVTYNPLSGEFQGWAWGGDLLGWVSFNALTCDADEDGFSDGSGAALSLTKTKIITDDASPEAADPEVDETVTYLDGPNDLYVKDGYAYVVSNTDNTFSIFDITTNPAQPTLVGTLRDGDVQGVSSHYLAIDDPAGAADGNTSKVYTSSATYQRDQYSLPDPNPALTDASNPISMVTYYMTSISGCRILTAHSGVDDEQVFSETCSSGGGTVSTSIGTQPSGAVWTWDAVRDLSFKLDLKQAFSSYDGAVTQIYARVDYSGAGSPLYLYPDGDMVSGIDNVLPVSGGTITVDGLAGAIDVAVSGNYAYVSGNNEDAFAVIDITDKANPLYVTHLQDREQWGGGGPHALYGPQDIEIYGNYAYVASVQDHAISIIDISNPASPVEVGVLVDDDSLAGGGNTGGIGTVVRGLRGTDDIDIEGNYLYVVGYDDGAVSIFDLTSPTSPSLVSMVTDNSSTETGFATLVTNHLDGPEDVEVESGYMYVAATNGPSNTADAISIFDISNPASPTIESVIVDDEGDVQASSNGETLIPAVAIETPEDFAVVGTDLYVVSAWDDALSLYDVSNPANPTLVFTIADDESLNSSVNYTDGGDNKVPTLDLGEEVEVVGSYIYTISWNDDALSTFAYVPASGGVPGCPPAGAAVEDYAVLYDTSNFTPDAPTISGVTTGSTSISYEFGFEASDRNGDDVQYGVDWDMSGGGFVQIDTEVDSGANLWGYGIWGDENYLYAAVCGDASGEGTLRSYSLDGGGNITPVDIGVGGSIDCGSVWGDGNYLYFAHGSDDLQTYSVDASGNVTLESTASYGSGFMMDVWGDGVRVYAAHRTYGLMAFTVDANGVLTEIDRDDPGGGDGRSVWGDGEFIYFGEGDYSSPGNGDSIHSYRLSGGTLVHIDSQPLSGTVMSIWGDGKFIYAVSSAGDLNSYSVDASGYMTLIDSHNPGGQSVASGTDVWGDGKYVYMAKFDAGIFSYRVDDFGNLIYMRNIDPGRAVRAIWSDGEYLYAAKNDDAVGAGVISSFSVDLGVDEWVPAPVNTYVSSGVQASTTQSWMSPGVYTFQALTLDQWGLYSAWTQHTITITSGGTLPTINLSASPSQVATGNSSTLVWSTVDANSCTASANPVNTNWSGDLSTIGTGDITNGSQTTGALSGSVGTVYTFTLECTNTDGTSSTSTTVEIKDTECSDGINNDGGEDADIDYPADSGCSSAADDSESPNPQCSDDIDNDGDGFIDYDGNGSTTLIDSACADRYGAEEIACGNGLCELGESFVSCYADCSFLWKQF